MLSVNPKIGRVKDRFGKCLPKWVCHTLQNKRADGSNGSYWIGKQIMKIQAH